MREIKFRAWDRVLNYMATQGTPDIETLAGFAHHYMWDDKAFETGGLVLMQYTGLKDKNGVEIYEGDILSSEHYNNNPWVVEWDSDYARFAVTGASDSEDLYDGFTQIREVIGNIYENPELLAKSKA